MLDLMSFNFEVKIAGKHITLKKYSKTNQFNYTVKSTASSTKRGDSVMKRENFIKSIMRARKKVFDTIACNVNCIPDYKGEIQRPKFLTLTFKENIQDLKNANAEFTKFNKRLSYFLYGINKNVLKYICIPEFQKRGAVHFHILYFNLPYVDFKDLGKIWGQGYVFIEGIKEKEEVQNFAEYVSKYINKENSKGEDNYNLYLEKDLLNQKRYFVSRGLNKPEIYKLNIDKDIYNTFIAFLKEFHSSNHTYENEFIGTVDLNNYEIEDRQMLDSLKNAITTITKVMFELYDKKVKIKKKHVKKLLTPFEYYKKLDEYNEWLYLREKMKDWMQRHNIERVIA